MQIVYSAKSRGGQVLLAVLRVLVLQTVHMFAEGWPKGYHHGFLGNQPLVYNGL